MRSFETRCLSSLAKVFPDREPGDSAHNRAFALQGETYSFQVAYRLQGAAGAMKNVRVHIEADSANEVFVRSVGLVPSEFPCYGDHDDYVLQSAPGLFPDPLFPITEEEGLTVPPGQWRSVWVTVQVRDDSEAGIYPVEVRFADSAGETLGQESFGLEVIPARLPEQKLIHTEWLHVDCIALQYGVEMFSEAHWTLIENYARCAAEHGMNMLLTPLFTYPLDTKPGGERPTVQLIGVRKEGDVYTFDFSLLQRWVEMFRRTGFRYMEFSHLYTQWGARHCPKVMAYEDGEYRRMFGWDTDAASWEYDAFLGQFFPELVRFIRENGLEERSFFHVSDEPQLDHLDTYSHASRTIRTYLDGFPVIDALSDFEFYEQGIVTRPIPASDHIQPFLEAGVPKLWTYYCCAQYKGVSNRFFSMPSARNRIIGVQLYKYAMEGFLHWGYNFWFTQYSVRPVDPFRTTDAGLAFPSGDAFLVYPGADGPLESIRMEVLVEAMQDIRALELLESLTGREQVLAWIESEAGGPLTFDAYPREAEWLLRFREAVNRRIRQAVDSLDDKAGVAVG